MAILDSHTPIPSSPRISSDSEVQIMADAIVEVFVIPDCDFCAERGSITPAQYDGRTVLGPWANMCAVDFTLYGTGLGLGKGQRLVLKEKER